MAARHTVRLTEDAKRDLDELAEFVALNDSPASALRLIERLQAEVETLALSPERGTRPRELAEFGLREFRQVSMKPYRLVHRIDAHVVHVVLIVDGRRDMRAVLQRRLLRA
jgi:toxin ParE1/3/4